MGKKKRFAVDYSAVEQQVWQMAEPLVIASGAELIDVEYVREGGDPILRLYIERAEASVDHELCQKVSDLLSPALDKNDPVDEAYFLEISSPGLERPLKRAQDFARFAGAEIVLKLYAPHDGKKVYSGRLLGLSEAGVSIEVNGATLVFAEDSIAKAHLKAEL